MKNYRVISAFLVVVGLVGILVGICLAFFPVEMRAQYGIMINGSISQLSEIRSSGVVILSIGVIIFIGAFKYRWRPLALILSAIVFLSYGIGRLLSIAMDGMPTQGLLQAMGIELAIGILAVLALRKIKGVKEN